MTPARSDFERTVDAVDDLGMDNSGGSAIDDDLDAALETGTLIEFPPGEYQVARLHEFEDWTGIVGTGDAPSDVRFVPPAGESFKPFWFGHQHNSTAHGHIRLENVTLDRLEDWDSSLGLGGHVTDDLLLKDVHYDGWTHGQQMLTCLVVDPDGEAVVDGMVRMGPTRFEPFPDGVIDIWSGRGHRGHLTLRNIEIHNGSESGIYTGKAAGSYLIEDSYFKNVVHTAIRCAGADSTVRNCTVVIDTEDWHPSNDERNLSESPPLVRGLWAQSSTMNLRGPRIDGCDVIVRNADQHAAAAILVAPDTGGAVVRDTRIQCDADTMVPLWAKSPRPDEAGESLAMDLENVTVVGDGWRGGGITVHDRPGSKLRDCCVASPSRCDGVEYRGCDGGCIEDSTVNVGGARLNGDGSMTTSNLDERGSCDGPVEPATTPAEGDYRRH